MDKLEKALQKAREMRSKLGGAEAAPSPGRRVLSPILTRTESPGPGGGQSAQVTLSDAALRDHRIVARLSRDATADIFKVLRTKVIQAMTRENMKTIAITSANYGEGKTTIAVNLAISMALDVKQTVLLVDLDLRNPTVHEYMGFQTETGLSDYFLHDVPVTQCLVKPSFDRLTVLPITKPIDSSSELLGSPKMAALANELKTRYADRLVIYDMPPLLSQDDTIAFLPHVDGVILVVRDGMTPAEDVEHSLHALDGSRLIGTVLNNCADTRFNKL